MQPRVVDPRSVAHRVGQAVGGIVYNPENEKSSRAGEPRGRTFARPTKGCRQGAHGCNAYDSGAHNFERTYSGDNDHGDRDEDKAAADCEVYNFGRSAPFSSITSKSLISFHYII